MVRRPSTPLSPVLRSLRRPRRGLVHERRVAASLISVAGLAGRPCRNRDGSDVGRIVDVVARWSGETYPTVTGLVVRVGRRRVFVPVGQLGALSQTGAQLGSARLDLVDFARRPGEVVLIEDVIDHQLIDVDGVQVIRASDLYIARTNGDHRLVGVDVAMKTLLRRLGPRRWRSRPTPGKVIDWAAIQPFGTPGGAVRLTGANRELHRLGPSDLADLVEELGYNERQELLFALDSDAAADVLEELSPGDVVALLREAGGERAAVLVASMQPDEAVDALRELAEGERAQLLEQMPGPVSDRLRRLLAFDADTAGGLMTPVLVAVPGHRTVTDIRQELRGHADHASDVDAVLVLDQDGRLLDDITLFELLLAEPGQLMLELIGEPWPITVAPDAPIDEVLDALTDNRRASIVVVDDGRPIGRILADDLLDALTTRRRSLFSRLPS